MKIKGAAAFASGAVVLAGLLIFAVHSLSSGAAGVTEGARAADFSLPALDGEEVKLAEVLRDGEAVLVFWATWCPPCVASIPEIRKFYAGEQAREKETGRKRVTVLSVNIGERKEAVAAFAARHRIDYPVLLDADNAVARAYQVRGVPTVVLIERGGRIRHRGHSFSRMAGHFFPDTPTP